MLRDGISVEIQGDDVVEVVCIGKPWERAEGCCVFKIRTHSKIPNCVGVTPDTDTCTLQLTGHNLVRFHDRNLRFNETDWYVTPIKYGLIVVVHEWTSEQQPVQRVYPQER